jgi:hypothetical protein
LPKPERIRIVPDNLSTHSAGALYQTFRRPKRDAFCAGWSSIRLNTVEIKIGVLRSQCLDPRIDSKARFVSELAAW